MNRRGYFMLLKSEKYHYLSFRNLEDNDITLTVRKNNDAAPTVKFYHAMSEHSAGTYAESSTDGVRIIIPANGTLYIRGVGNTRWGNVVTSGSTTTLYYNNISCNGRYSVSGDILSLLDASNVASGQMTANSAFCSLFRGDDIGVDNASTLVDASGVVLPSVVRQNCFRTMFYKCAALENTPTIPATTVKPSCFESMFYKCTSLVTTPKLDFEFGNESGSSCRSMFEGCTALVSVGEGSTFHRKLTTTMPNTSLYAMLRMFKGCTSMTEGVDMDFPNISQACCVEMYTNCTSLQSVPKLSNRPDYWCLSYHQGCMRMFMGCTSLTSIGNYITFDGNGFAEMYKGCTSIVSLPQNARLMGDNSASLVNYTGTNEFVGAKQGMFENCTNLIDASGVSFVVNNGSITTDCRYVFAKIFKGCKKLTEGPDLSLVKTCTGSGLYQGSGMFYQAFMNCTSLVTPPALPPFTVVFNMVYRDMFNNCTSLATTPQMNHITTVDEISMQGMFYNCTSLTAAQDLDSILTINNSSAFNSMYDNCSNILQVPKLPTIAVTGNTTMGAMFQNCSKMTGVATFKVGNSNTAPLMFNGTKITGVVVINDDNQLGQWAFAENSSLKDVDITRFFPTDFITGNPANPHYNFVLDSLTIRGDYPPSSITSLFIDALAPTCPIKVHANQVEAYKAAAVWTMRADYISAITD